MNKDKVYLKGYVIGRAADTLGYEGLMVQLENLDIVEIDKNLVHQGINEPQKVTIPQFVADWYEKNKDDLETSLFNVIYEIFKKRNDNELSEFEGWVIDNYTEPFKTIVNMHQFGYEVKKEKKEKRYRVRAKGICFNSCLIFEKINKTWLFSSIYEIDHQRGNHTRKELEKAGFGEVFDSTLFEVEEVEE